MDQNNQIGNQNINEPQSKSNLSEQSKIKKIKTKQTIAAEPEEDEDLVYEKVKQSRFKQQNLPAWRPVPTILSIVIVFTVFGILFVILGIVLLVYSNKVKSAKIDYTDCGSNDPCNKQLTLEDDIDAPVFVYYQLDGFFQNSRRYLKSKETDQLTGDDIKAHDNCEPIAFGKDKKLYDKNPDPSKQWIDMTNEHFLVWMRPSGLPNPRKLWGRINRDLKKGETIDITIDNKYNVNNYKGKKKIVLSNATRFGGKNKFLGVSYIVVGALSILCAILFPIGYQFQLKKEKEL